MKKSEKSVFIDNLSADLESATAIFVVNYAGLSVPGQRELKKRLKEVNARFVVVKNTLFKLASVKANLPSDAVGDTVLSGQNALVLAGDDPIKPITEILKFAKEFEILKLKIGVVEGSYVDTQTLENLSSLGGKSGIYAQLVGLLVVPTYSLVNVLQAKMQELTFVIDQLSKRA